MIFSLFMWDNFQINQMSQIHSSIDRYVFFDFSPHHETADDRKEFSSENSTPGCELWIRTC